MSSPLTSASGSAEEIATALLAKLTLQSSDLRRTRSEFSVDELDRLESNLLFISCSMSTIRNAFAPINILPSEILAYIFAMLVKSPRPPQFLPDLEVCKQPYAWVTVTHVCRYWRETALSFPALWSNIDSYSTLAALTFLDRSAAADARVYLRDAIGTSGISPSLDRGRFLQALAYHSERFEELHIQPAFRYGPVILRWFQHPAPKLQALTIMLNLNKEGTHELPPLFDGHIPNLKKLTLANFSQWSLHQFGGKLTHLCLMDQPLRGRMSMERFVDFLSSCEALEELALIDAGPNVWDTAFGLGDSEKKLVRFERLRTLHIGDWHTPQCVARFLEHLVLPPTTKIFVWADCLFRQEELFTMLLPGSLKNLYPFHRLTAFHLTYRPATRDHPQLLSVQDGVLVLYLHFAMPASVEMLESVFSQVNLLHVEELTLGFHSKPEPSEASWRSIFYKMPHVRTLNILRRPSRPILAALSPENPSDEVPCPALDVLTITDDRAVSSIRLFLFAEERAQHGIPLRRLQVVSNMNMYSYRLEDEMEDMRSQIAEVEYMEDELIDVKQLPVGWPTATYRWLLDVRDGRSNHGAN
ncbi:hypothetical protein BDY19DRAFT_990382 [Irpex rosettiformis]|uniref:Uncharacterized protein n=1 Tax=Irpex rosettiformis TaxID=378272 RepID=A0ACB8UEV5_9APHY|nr:hypothetical protein BDY19DRAFT_990382 [Irpex rosettiformis]